jgi:predicted O-methyltransferase YrrM
MSRYDFTGLLEWNKIPGWFSANAALAVQSAVKQLPPGAVVVELGSFQGRSSVALAAVLPDAGVLYCVDHFRGSAEHQHLNLSDLFPAFQKNLETFGVRQRVRPLVMSTLEAAGQFAEASVDLLLVDASHDYASVKGDLETWYPKLKAGGWLFCDDYEPRWPEVVRAIQDMHWEGTMAAPALWLHRKPFTAA